jgi:hypothetical protein
MFRLLKLAFYAVLGYAIYEFIRGMTQTAQANTGPRAKPSQRQQRESGSGSSDSPVPGANMTGGGAGEKLTTAEPTGESVTHRVGRGVVAQ